MINVSDVANYFLSLVDVDADDCISNLKLQKLCYYAQGFHLAIYGTRLFNEDIQAWQHGPVVPSLYRKYKDAGKSCLMPDDDFDSNILPAEIVDLLNEVYQNYGQFSAWRLRDMTHQESPWKTSYNKTSDDVISDEKLIEFFKTRLA